MIPVLSRAQMRAFDARAIGSKVPSLVLMENAGRGAADVIERTQFGERARGRRVVVLCGVGNNGGDGFVVARHLCTRGALVNVWLVGDAIKMTADCRANYEAFVGIGGTVEALCHGGDLVAIEAAIAGAELLVDALFGIGLDRPIGSPFKEVIALANAAHSAGTVIAALDVPSGLDADTGQSLGTAIEADLTISFAHLKLGHMTPAGARRSGRVHVVDIGVPPSLRTERSADLVEAGDVRARFTARTVDTHKYRAGHVVVFAGSRGKTGAALLAARAALRGGAGAVTIATWPDAAIAMEGKTAEVMVAPLPEGDTLLEYVDGFLSRAASVVIGPGFGTDVRARAALQHVLAAYAGPIVVDADALTMRVDSLESLAATTGSPLLTPHTGELGRLLGRSSAEIEADRFGAAKEAARRTQAVVLLKGAVTIVAEPDGRVVVTASGSPALATAGSGDVLAGLLGALACTLPPFEAAYSGAFVHGAVGRAWQTRHGDRGLLAGEIADGLPDELGRLTST